MALVNIEHDGHIARIALARSEKLNALTPEMIAEIGTSIETIERQSEARVIVLHGEGRAFCVGADVNRWSALSAEEVRRSWITDGHRVFDRIESCRLPVIAAVHGLAFGGGLELALAADLRVFDAEAQVALPETGIGTVPGWGGTQRLTRLIGPSRAKLMALTGRRIGAEQALSWGLAAEIAEPGTALQCAMALATEIAQRAPVCTQLTKSILNGGGGVAAGMTFELLAGMNVVGTADAVEGIRALREKREPNFSGR
jgi:enoyl-CoA hydratase/carnithine racemase